MKRSWWKEVIVYQIYPRSYKDSNGDGIGDLRGIISKLDYIQSLGIDVIWLNPIYSSPNDDNGYDISDYENIMEEFGTMEDFDELLTKLHQRGIKLILDLVVNHCSDEHFWFQESRKSRDNPYRDYFHWVPAENGKPNPRWSFFDPEGDAWKYDEKTDSYYLHYFSQKQPDLKWENPTVRKEIYDMMHFWFKKGIDGFRMDVITFISKDLNYPPVPEKYKGKFWDFFYSSGPKLHEYLQEMNQEVLSHYDIMTVAEGSGMTTDNILDLVSEDRQELNMAYHFDHTFMGLMDRKVLNENYNNLVQFKKIHTKWDKALKNEGWGAIYLGNHDQPRMVTRWTNDDPKYRAAASKMLNTWILSMRGTPYLYQGDEIGMTNIKFDDIKDYKDIETINWYYLTQKEGGDLQRFMESHKIIGRDNGRTPIQWNDSPNAGFTSGQPWIKVNPNYSEINVSDQEIDPNSQLNYFKKMVQLRKQHQILIYGDYQLLLPDNKEIYAYTRTLEKEKMLVVLNFTKNKPKIVLEEITLIEEQMINNYDSVSIEGPAMTFLPYQAVIFRLQF